MASQSKSEAQNRYQAAFEVFEEARTELRAAREELDEFLREEEVVRHAVYIGFDEGDEDGIRAARKLIERRRAEKAAAKELAASEADGPIGGVA